MAPALGRAAACRADGASGAAGPPDPGWPPGRVLMPVSRVASAVRRSWVWVAALAAAAFWAASLRACACLAAASSRPAGAVSSSTSRGGRGSSPRRTTTLRTKARIGRSCASSAAAGPLTTTRRNHRGPSTPRKRAGWKATRPSGARPGIRARSSLPMTPSTASAAPPASTIPRAMSGRSSSHRPVVRGAANTCSWTWEAPKVRVAPTTRPEPCSRSRRICIPAWAGRRSAPRSRRPSSADHSVMS
ncbi:hypothetical protein BJF81_09935 [Ornithinimicrobium sp. CNJ-824]|nr:hypothetical protein BJF81_09935 [Ornithinimicrobium sp. CNJ-824]